MAQTRRLTGKHAKSSRDNSAIPASRFNKGWIPRAHQQRVIDRFDAGVRYHDYIWHRRAGKDSVSINIAADQAKNNVGTYWHLFPLHVQARRAIWKGMDNVGLRFIDQAFPDGKRFETDMMIELPNGSTWQLTGSDYYDRLVGANVRGVVFSEWALCDPRAWNYIRPIIRENNGWVCFITTFRGRNHAYQMYQRVKNNPEWACEILTVNDTYKADGSRIITDADIQAERDGGMSEAMIQQEYYCNPLASAEGSIYGAPLAKLLGQQNTKVEYDPKQPVTASWSLKYLPVNVSVMFSQGKNVIGSRSWMFETFATALSEANRDFPWMIGTHVSMDTPEHLQNMFDAGLYPRTAICPDDPSQITSAAIISANIDTEVRKFEPEGNNLLLVEALNGYSARETNLNTWSMTGVSEYNYLTRAFETYAVWNHHNPTSAVWGRGTDYTLHDRGVI